MIVIRVKEKYKTGKKREEVILSRVISLLFTYKGGKA